MTRLRPFQQAAFLISVSLWGQCPDNGQILVLKQDKGMQLVRFFGKDSFKGTFRGPGFTWVEEDKRNPEPTFWIDGLLVQWLFFARSEFMKGEASDERGLREAFYKYEVDYLTGLHPDLADRLNIERFEFIGDLASDGTKHTFLIWSATPRGNGIKQYWVVTAHPRGVVSMTVILRASTDEPKAKSIIDAYMGGYGLLPAGEAATFMKALHELEGHPGPPQVPLVKRSRGKKHGTSSIPFPPAETQPSH